MRDSVLIFILSAIIGLGVGYYYFAFTGESNQQVEQTVEESAAETETPSSQKPAEPVTVNANAEVLTDKGCIQCHSISELNLNGGVTGPDLSNAYSGVEGKHGKPLDEFLKAPTSAVMSSVIKGNPLTDEERAKIVEILKNTAEQ